MTGKYWKRICAIPAYMFLLSPSGSRVQKMEGGNWIDQHEAQKVVDAAEDELSGLVTEIKRQAAQFKEWQASHHANYVSVAEERDQLKTECEGLRKDSERYKWTSTEGNWVARFHGRWRAHVGAYGDAQPTDWYPSREEAIDAAMTKDGAQ